VKPQPPACAIIRLTYVYTWLEIVNLNQLFLQRDVETADGVQAVVDCVAWLSERVRSPNPEAEALKITGTSIYVREVSNHTWEV